MAEWISMIKSAIQDAGMQYPWILFVALVLLPGVGFPVSLLLLTAGFVWGTNPGSCGLAVLAVGLNIVWTHLLAKGPARSTVQKLLGERWKRWENLPHHDLMKVALVLRVTPGVPLFVQNYVLGLLGVPLRYSLGLALPFTTFYVCGFVLTGGAIFEGHLGKAVTGLGLLILVAVVLRWVRQAMARKNRAA